MHRSIIRACLFLFVFASSFAVQATGLGNLTLNSYLGQPFKAEIDIVSVSKEDIPTLSAKLASREIFQQSNVDYAPFLFTFKVSIENRADGQPYIKITSPQRVVEPFLSMLIELNWSSGRLIREYTVLLDPPEDALEPALPAMQVEPVVPSSVKPEPAAAEQPDSIIVDENIGSNEEPTVMEVIPEESEVISEQALESKQKSSLVGESVTTYGPVKGGDTLVKIAEKVAPPRVQLNQMLIAIHRANREAFSDNNMHRLKTGPILRIPDVSEIAAISPDAADKEIKIQTANWEAYRQKLAAEVDSATSTGEESAQTATGKITAMIDNLAETAKKQPKEKLSISKGEGIERSNGENTTSSALDKIRALEESAIAKEKALNEANERVALLEKNIEELRQLLELKNADMAELQNQVEPELSPATEVPSADGGESSAVEEPTVDNGESSVEDEGLSASNEGESTTTESPDTAETPKETSAPASLPIKNTPPVVVVEDPPLMDSIGPIIDSLMENIEYVGAALLLLLIGVFAVNRKKKAAVNDTDLDESNEKFSSGIPDEPSIDNAGEAKKTKQADDYDPVVEAGQYLDHKRDVQAEKILKDALAKDKNNPEILAKLLEVYSQRKDKSSFETTARKLWAVSPTGSLWEKTAKLGLSIDPENPFYGGSVAASADINQVGKDTVSGVASDKKAFATGSDFAEMKEHEPEASEPENKEDPDFGIEFSSSGEDESVTDKAVTIDFPASSDNEKDINEDTSIDFPDTSQSEETIPTPILPEADLADINLNIDDSISAKPASDTQSVERSAQWHEIATKIDLARAYQEMGDIEGAKEILQEVLKDGDTKQQEGAKAILESL